MNANRYFSVPYDGRNDVTIRLLRKREGGLVAHGRWMALLGMLYDSDGILQLEKPNVAELIAEELDFNSEDELRGYLETLAELELIDATSYTTRSHVINPGVVKEINYRRAKSEAGKTGNRNRWNKDDNKSDGTC